jgi:NADPH2:quinone reductase
LARASLISLFYLAGLAGFGSYAQFSKADAQNVFKLPAEWNLEEAATSACVVLTAAIALYEKLKIASGDWILINGGSGGVGSVAVQLAAYSGAKVIATCSAKNIEFVKGLGALEVIDYTKEDIVARVKEITGGAGAQTFFDTVATDPAKLFGAVAFGGAIATILPCGLDGPAAFALFASNLSLHPILVMAFMGHANAKAKAAMTPVFAAIKAGKFKVPISKRFTLDEVQAAMVHNMEGRTQGKTVIIIDETVA